MMITMIYSKINIWIAWVTTFCCLNRTIVRLAIFHFPKSAETYTHYMQQREIQELVPDEAGMWNKDMIERRQERIVHFVLETF